MLGLATRRQAKSLLRSLVRLLLRHDCVARQMAAVRGFCPLSRKALQYKDEARFTEGALEPRNPLPAHFFAVLPEIRTCRNCRPGRRQAVQSFPGTPLPIYFPHRRSSPRGETGAGCLSQAAASADSRGLLTTTGYACRRLNLKNKPGLLRREHPPRATINPQLPRAKRRQPMAAGARRLNRWPWPSSWRCCFEGSWPKLS